MPDKKIVLVIDDEPFIVDMITTFLGLKGYEVHSAYNGQDGLTLIPLEKPDVLLLDLMLPDIGGFEICQRVRAMPDFAQMPILIVSARNEPESKTRAEKVGANGYLTKPIRMFDLIAEMEKILSASPAPPTMPVSAGTDRPAPAPPPADTPTLPGASQPPAPPDQKTG
jgi:DNA-binding response OmpR family regulator